MLRRVYFPKVSHFSSFLNSNRRNLSFSKKVISFPHLSSFSFFFSLQNEYFMIKRRNFSDIFKNKKPPSSQTQQTPFQPSQTQQKTHPPPQQPQPSHDKEMDDHPLILEVNMTNFIPFVLQSSVPVILECYADYFEEGKNLSSSLQSLVEQSQGSIRLARLNVDQASDLAERLRITNVPTVIGFLHGKVVNSFMGVPSSQAIVGNKLFFFIELLSNFSNRFCE